MRGYPKHTTRRIGNLWYGRAAARVKASHWIFTVVLIWVGGCGQLLGLEERSLDQERLTKTGYPGCVPETDKCEQCTSEWHTCICEGWSDDDLEEAELRLRCAEDSAPQELKQELVKEAQKELDQVSEQYSEDNSKNGRGDAGLADASMGSNQQPDIDASSEPEPQPAVQPEPEPVDCSASLGCWERCECEGSAVSSCLVECSGTSCRFGQCEACSDCIGRCRCESGDSISNCQDKCMNAPAPGCTPNEGCDCPDCMSSCVCNGSPQTQCQNQCAAQSGPVCTAGNCGDCPNCVEQCKCEGGTNCDVECGVNVLPDGECAIGKCTNCTSCAARCACNGGLFTDCISQCDGVACSQGSCSDCTEPGLVNCECSTRDTWTCVNDYGTQDCWTKYTDPCHQCGCSSCPLYLDSCEQASGCMDLRECMQSTRCLNAEDCNRADACGSLIADLGGVDSEEVALAEALAACESNMGCMDCQPGGAPPEPAIAYCGNMSCWNYYDYSSRLWAQSCCTAADECGLDTSVFWGDDTCRSQNSQPVYRDSKCGDSAPLNMPPYNGSTLIGCCTLSGKCGYEDVYLSLGCLPVTTFEPNAEQLDCVVDPTSIPGLIDNLEDGDEDIVKHEGLNGWWVSDSEGAGTTPIQTPAEALEPLDLVDPNAPNNYAMHFSVSNYPSTAWAYFGITLASDVDGNAVTYPGAANYWGISFRAKSNSDSGEFAYAFVSFVMPSTLDSGDYHGTSMSFSSTWQTYYIGFDHYSIYQRYSPGDVEFNPAELLHILWELEEGDTGFDIWVDDVMFTY